MTLRELLDLHVRLVGLVAESLKPGDDVTSMCGAFRDGHVAGALPVLLTASAAAREQVHKDLMVWLREAGADAYTWVSAGWSVEVRVTPQSSLAAQTAAILAAGGVKNVPGRHEVLVCLVGDRDETLSMELRVHRDEAGKITRLDPGEVSTRGTGLFHDMLLVPKTRAN